MTRERRDAPAARPPAIALKDLERENRELRGRFDALERDHRALVEENRFLSRRFVELEAQNSELASLYVASHQLLGAPDREAVLLTVQEILVNLVGSEEFAIFETDPRDGTLSVAASLNVDCRRIPIGSGTIGRVARTGDPFFADEKHRGEVAPGEMPLTACIPLKLEGQVTGVIAVYRLLPQKPGLAPIDRQLFDLLGRQAASALYITALHARPGAAPAARV